MRVDQYMGLNKWARRLLSRKLKGVVEVGQLVYPSGKVVPFERKQVSAVKSVKSIGYIRGRYVARVARRKEYTMHDGRVFTEVVQDVRHCGGPNYFIALADADGNLVPSSLWTEAQMSM